MAKFYKKTRPSDTHSAKINGEEIGVSLKRMTTLEYIQFTSDARRLSDLHKDGEVSTEAFQIMITSLKDVIVEVHGLMDEDGQEVKWADLDDCDKHSLVDQLDIDSLGELYHKAASSGGLSEQEKKA